MWRGSVLGWWVAEIECINEPPTQTCVVCDSRSCDYFCRQRGWEQVHVGAFLQISSQICSIVSRSGTHEGKGSEAGLFGSGQF